MSRVARGPRAARGRAIAAWAGALACLVAAPGSGAGPETVLPAGTTLSVRLTSRVGSHTSHVDEPVTAVLIAPVRVDDEPVVPSGWTVRGRVAAPPGSALAPPDIGAPELRALVSRLPRRAVAARNRQPSDLTNVLLVGSIEQAAAAFREAGWTQALPSGVRADLRSFLALAHRHGYEPAPVSLLELDGRRPGLVLEKQTNTLAKRHHVRFWAQPLTLDGAPVLLGAATHDTGIRFSREQKTFTHEIHPHIDLERDKIVDDLAFTGRLAARAMVERPDAPRADRNAAGDRFETDGRVAVLFLR